MSIINDAIRKARKESGIEIERHIPIFTEPLGQKSRPKFIVLLMLLVLLLVSVVLSKFVPKQGVISASSVGRASSRKSTSIISNQSQQSLMSSFTVKQNSDMELSGIVCDRERVCIN